jgi:hypothetical protein
MWLTADPGTYDCTYDCITLSQRSTAPTQDALDPRLTCPDTGRQRAAAALPRSSAALPA